MAPGRSAPLDRQPVGHAAMAAGLAMAVVGLEDLLGPAADELRERMAAATTWPCRFAVLDELLVRRGERMKPAPPILDHLWRRLVGSGGAVRVIDLADEVGWSRRYLGARFSAEFGLSPKDVVRVARFDRAKRLLKTLDRPTLAEVAAVCGYYDQPHLARGVPGPGRGGGVGVVRRGRVSHS